MMLHLELDPRIEEFVSAIVLAPRTDEPGGRERHSRLRQELKSMSDADAQAALIALFHIGGELGRAIARTDVSIDTVPRRKPEGITHVVKFGDLMLQRRLALAPSEFGELLCNGAIMLNAVSYDVAPHLERLVECVESRWEELKGNEGIRTSLGILADAANATARVSRCDSYSGIEKQDLAHHIAHILDADTAIPLDEGEPWADRAIADIRAMSPDLRRRWVALLWHCRRSREARPTANWRREAAPLLETLGPTEFRNRLLAWLPLVDLPRLAPAPPQWHAPHTLHWIWVHHAEALKGLCWAAARRRDDDLARALATLAVSCYRKAPGAAPRAVKVGNAAVIALGEMPGRVAIAHLAMLRTRIKFGTTQRMVTASLAAAAKREGLPEDEIEEIAAPSFALSEVGRAEQPFGDRVAILSVDGPSLGTASIRWIDAKGKESKSTPSQVKAEHAEALKLLNNRLKDIRKMLPAQRDRIEKFFLEPRSWPLSTWRERYLDHPLVGVVARRLIWLFKEGDVTTAAAWLRTKPDDPPHGPGQLVRADGSPFQPSEGAVVSLWHPIGSEPEPGAAAARPDIVEWRTFYEANRIRQPFKQAHREVYLLTDAERRTETYSNRFAGHFIRQSLLHALVAERFWRDQLQMMDGEPAVPPHRLLSSWGLRAEFWVQGAGEDAYGPAAYTYLATDQVRFYRLGAARAGSSCADWHGRTPPLPDDLQNQPIPLEQIPPIVLSETFRDVDLFVGVASVGALPEWRDRGPDDRFHDYWSSYAFGALSGVAETRRDQLARLIPRLRIANSCTRTDRFLVVIGRKRTYKIHLGSGNILMSPNDQYLCIVPRHTGETQSQRDRLFLPFEGDHTLSVILSKAILLAEDDKITDPDILRQIDAP